MESFTILHLSDIHFKTSATATVTDVHGKLARALETYIKTHQPPDYVVVSGDIAFSGKEAEYTEARRFFETLKNILPAGVQFLPVPGNHDLDRAFVDEDFFSLHQIVKDGK
ncbi:MAG: hypothetical protein GY765_20515, partial [bacterium]|nr:hypothetical protein [bacterium]